MKPQMVEITAKEHEILVAIAHMVVDADIAERFPEYGKEYGFTPDAKIEEAKRLAESWQLDQPTPFDGDDS